MWDVDVHLCLGDHDCGTKEAGRATNMKAL